MKLRIKKLRKKLDLTQVQFAALLGVHPITVSRWERGAPLPPYNAQQIVAAEEGCEKVNPSEFHQLVQLGAFVDALALLIAARRVAGMKRA